MRARNEFILADMIAARAESAPDFDVVTFDGGGVRPHEVRTYADLWRNGNRVAAALLDRGSKTVIITLGPRGALVADRGSVSHYPAVEVPAVDSTGAGDAFVGSLAVFLAEGVPLPRSVARANAVAALSVATIGTQVSFPSRAEADTFLRERGLL